MTDFPFEQLIQLCSLIASVVLVASLFLLVRHLLLVAMHLFLAALGNEIVHRLPCRLHRPFLQQSEHLPGPTIWYMKQT